MSIICRTLISTQLTILSVTLFLHRSQAAMQLKNAHV